MYARAIFLLFIIFHGFFTSQGSRRCVVSHTSANNYGQCPASTPKCCGTTRYGRRNGCATSCESFACHSNLDCDGLVCCSGKCSSNKNCLPVTTWGVVGIAIVSLFVLLASFRLCQLCRTRKCCTRRDTRAPTEDQAYNEPPFVVSDFDNYGFNTPMAPPSYDSVVRDRESRPDGNLSVYNLNLQTIINNSSTIDPGPNNFEVNISIRGSTMFNNDFPPSYSEINNAGDNGDHPPSYSSNQGVENIEEVPPPYSLDEESQSDRPTDESPNNITTGSRIAEDFVYGNQGVEGRQEENSSVTEADSEQATPTCCNSDVQDVLDGAHSTGELLNYEQPCCSESLEDDTVFSELSNSSSGSDCAVSETTSTQF